jgi:hypothetical protein
MAKRRMQLPGNTNPAEALTDAPALLWRLALSAPEPLVLPRQPRS